jgi:hypothetical protein
VTIKNAVFCGIKNQFIPHRRHFTFPLQNPADKCNIRFEVFIAVTMKNAVFWDIKTQFVPNRRHIKFPLQIPAD